MDEAFAKSSLIFWSGGIVPFTMTSLRYVRPAAVNVLRGLPPPP